MLLVNAVRHQLSALMMHGHWQTRKQELIYGYQSIINDVFHISDVDVTSTINPRFDGSNEFTLKIDSLKASMSFVTTRKAALVAVSLLIHFLHCFYQRSSPNTTDLYLLSLLFIIRNASTSQNQALSQNESSDLKMYQEDCSTWHCSILVAKIQIWD